MTNSVIELFRQWLLGQTPAISGFGQGPSTHLAQGKPDLLAEPNFYIQLNANGKDYDLVKRKLNPIQEFRSESNEYNVVGTFGSETEAEKARLSLPRIRLPLPLFEYDEKNNKIKRLKDDFSNDGDAKDIFNDISKLFQFSDTFLNTFGAVIRMQNGMRPRFWNVKFQNNSYYGLTAQDQNDITLRAAFWINPFKHTGRFQWASTLSHELMHGFSFVARGFSPEYAAPFLSLEDFLVMTFQSEFEAFEMQVTFLEEIRKKLPEEFTPYIYDFVTTSDTPLVSFQNLISLKNDQYYQQQARTDIVETYGRDFKLTYTKIGGNTKIKQNDLVIKAWRIKAAIAGEPASAAWETLEPLLRSWREAGLSG